MYVNLSKTAYAFIHCTLIVVWIDIQSIENTIRKNVN